MSKKSLPLGAFSLIMINVIAIDNLRTLPFAAGLGLSLVTIYLLASICFLIPVGLVAAELATTWPTQGGIYVWIKQAFGEKWSLFIIWLQWIYNVVWYPTALAFILSTINYALGSTYLQDPNIFLIIMVIIFWVATFLNCFGMKISGAMSNICAILGTLIPMIIIIGLGAFWLHHSNNIAINLSWQQLLPNHHDNQDLPFLVEIIFGLVGLEMSAMHADQVRNPAKNFPRAILWSIIIIFLSLVFASLSIAVVIPKTDLNLITGISQALTVFLAKYNLTILHPIISVLIVIGGIGSIAAWIIGPTKGLLVAAQDGLVPKYFAKLNHNKVPVRILVMQACLVTLLAGFYIWMPNLESAYVILTVMTTQLSLLVYIGLFAAAWYLRIKHPSIIRPYKIPGGNVGIAICCLAGLITCISVIYLGFIPPEMAISKTITNQYITTLILGMIILCMPPLLLYKHSKTQ